MTLLIELVLLLAVVGATAWGAHYSIDEVLRAAALRGDVGDVEAVRHAGVVATEWFVAGVIVLAVVRCATALLRRGHHIGVPLSLPAATAALGLGFCVQLGYGSPWAESWPGPEFGKGVFFACLAASAILALPGDIGRLLVRVRWGLLATAVVLLLALAAFGRSPGVSGQKINLFGLQPIEAVKICSTLFIAIQLGQRAQKIRFQREVIGPLRLLRPRLFVTALAAVLVTWVGLFAVHDFGPTLILGGVIFGLFYVVTRSPVWVLVASHVVGLCLAFFAWNPELAPSSGLVTRLRMWLDPWLNGRPGGDQLARALWAIAAGGTWGDGVGGGVPAQLPAGHTDLIYAHLVEVLGHVGAVGYLLLLTITIIDGLRVAKLNRTPERVLMAAALGLLLLSQAVVILGGTLRLFPLTGVVVPFLSYGKTGTIAMLAIVALIVRLGENGNYQVNTDELAELRPGIDHLRFGVFLIGGLFSVATGWTAVLHRDEVTLAPLVTTLADGTPRLSHDPRLDAIARRMRRGEIRDREGRILAQSPAAGERNNPLGDAFGTVLGPADDRVGRAKWSLERQLDGRLRGYPLMADGPAVWMGTIGGRPQIVYAVRSAAAPLGDQEEVARARLAARGGTGEVHRVVLAESDFRPLLPVLRLDPAGREVATQVLADAVDGRSVWLTLDAALQSRLSKATRVWAAKSKVGAAAVVVMEPTTGEILARAQWPDYDPNGTAWRPLRTLGDPKFMGIYGAWSDKTGAHGVWQAGSAFKVLSSLVAVREGLVDGALAEGSSCPTSASPTFTCTETDAGKPSFTLPSWTRPIHDHGDGGARGQLDLVRGLTSSSNVYFAQLALKLGPAPYRRLRQDGVEFGNPGLLAETDGTFTGLGEAGSRRLAQTGFGQGAGSWSVTQAARVVAAVADGGRYRRCPTTMELGAPCETVELLPPGASLAPVLAGMEGVMRAGTGARLPKVAGVRLYGKTGTADAPGTRDERPYGIRPGSLDAPHSWFVAIAEPSGEVACGPGGKRFVIAAVVPHGGFGASAAGPLAIEAVRALQAEGWLPEGE